jgi:ABC-2 type transport system permease protein
MALYLRLLAASIRVRMQYKLDFLFTTLAYAVLTMADFLTVAAILYRYRAVAGWNIYEVATLSGVASSAYGLYRVFGGELDGFERYLVTGEFDTLLTRPWPTLASLLARNFDLGRAGALLQGLLVLTIGLRGIGLKGIGLRGIGLNDSGLSPWMAAYVYLLPVAGGCIFIGLSLAAAAAGFWLTRIYELQIFVLNAPQAAANYPQDLFPAWMRRLFLGVLPVSAMGYVPMRFALGKGGSAWSLAVPFVAAALTLWVAYRFWLWGERHYQSTGS